ncbi:MAG: hypothetical protein RMJ15_06325 [Nitrososphaerota archaeon]|nr:hypothetical protein [Candidatus Bathyarchaeota archaeon]MDW8023334.1 hypothetical protein [Nitrososphaerota archaeon]
MEKMNKIFLVAIFVQLIIIGFLATFLLYTLSKQRSFPAASARFIVWREGPYYYAADDSGIRFSGTNASWVIQSAINSLTEGRTWKEKIFLKGDFVIFNTIIVKSYTILEFQGKVTVGDYANIDAAIKSEGFDELAGTDSTGGVTDVEILGLVLDGNKAKQTRGFGLKLYGKRITLKDVTVYNFKEDGLWTEWSTSPAVGSPDEAMEGIFSNVRLCFNDGRGWRMLGPHDSYLTDILLYCNGLVGFACWGGGSCQGTNLHAYGNGEAGFYIDAQVTFTNIVSESNHQSGVIVLHNDVYLDGVFFGNGHYGIEMGDETRSPAGCYIRGKTLGHPADKAGLRLVNGRINRYELHMWEDTTIAGMLNPDDTYMIINTKNGQKSRNSGTATISAGSTSVTLVHSLVSVPRTVVVTGRSEAAAGVYVSFRNATHITIALTHAVPVDVEVDWNAEV